MDRPGGTPSLGLALFAAAALLLACGGRPGADVGDTSRDGTAGAPTTAPREPVASGRSTPAPLTPAVPSPSPAAPGASAAQIHAPAAAPAMATPRPSATQPATSSAPAEVPTPDLAAIERLLDELTDALANDATAPFDEGRP